MYLKDKFCIEIDGFSKVHAVSEVVFMGGTYTDRFQKGVEFNILVDPAAVTTRRNFPRNLTFGGLINQALACISNQQRL